MNSVSNNVLTEKSGFEAVKRGCGAFGEVGKIGGQLVDWLQGGEMTLNRVWENSACFTKPGARDKEVPQFQRKCSFQIFLGRSVFAIKTSATGTSPLPDLQSQESQTTRMRGEPTCFKQLRLS